MRNGILNCMIHMTQSDNYHLKPGLTVIKLSSMIFVLRALSKVLCLQGLDYKTSHSVIKTYSDRENLALCVMLDGFFSLSFNGISNSKCN